MRPPPFLIRLAPICLALCAALYPLPKHSVMGDSVFAPRVNSARLRDYAGQNRVVRLCGKLISIKPAENGREMVVLACTSRATNDITMQVPNMEGSNDRFVEILGVVKDASTLVFMSCTEMGSDLGLSFLDSSLPFLLNVCYLFFQI